MTSTLQPIKVYGKHGPNPPKITIVLGELGIPYEVVDIPFSEVKGPEYTAINPNGRLPAIQDPNTDITLWESGAIIEYLIERYDKDHKLSFATGTPESAHARQWLFFQVTGQGPYFGQLVWFKKYHAERLPSAVTRYSEEINRVTTVLEKYLGEQKEKHPSTDGPWLVGNKYSYADLSFIPWYYTIAKIADKEEYDESKYPLVKEWLNKMIARPAVQAILP